MNTTSNSNSISIIPDPNKGIFTLSGHFSHLPPSATIAIELLDESGRTFFSDSMISEDGFISKVIMLSRELPNGYYRVRITAADQGATIGFSIER